MLFDSGLSSDRAAALGTNVRMALPVHTAVASNTENAGHRHEGRGSCHDRRDAPGTHYC